jgi:hypothetical protein
MSDPRGGEPAAPGPAAVSRGAHVFAIVAAAVPIPRAAGPTIREEVEVALLAIPRVGEDFWIRAPRGVVHAGALFVLRRSELGRPHIVLVRALSVTESTGVRFDIVTARIESSEATPEGPLASSESEPAEVTETSARADCEAAKPRVDRQRVSPPRATANAVSAAGLKTIGGETRVSVLGPVAVGKPLKLGAARGKIPAGAYFALRYADDRGAKVALVRAISAQPAPGMLDTIRVDVLAPPEAVPERRSYRAPVDVYFTATLITRGSRRTLCRLVDLSAEGAGFQANAVLEPGDRLMVSDLSLPHLDGVELVVVRRDPQDARRYGALFAEPNRGASIISAMLDLDKQERTQEHRAQTDLFRRGGSGTARPVTREDLDPPVEAGMRTRPT